MKVHAQRVVFTGCWSCVYLILLFNYQERILHLFLYVQVIITEEQNIIIASRGWKIKI